MILIALLIIVLLLTGFVIFYIVHLNRYKKFSKQGIIGPKPQFPFGNTKDSALKRRNVVYEIDDIYRTFKSKSPVVGFFLMFKPYLLATDPELIKRVTIKDFKTFRNNDFNVDIVKHPVIGRSPFRLKDDVWKEKRSEITSGLTSNRLKAMYPLIIDGTKSFVDYIDQEISKNKMKVFDARDICARYTCDTISSFIFGADAQSFTSKDPFYMKMGEKLVQAVVNSVKTFLPFTMLTREVETFFIDMAQQAMKYRRETKILRDDFMSHLMNLREKTGLSETDAGANCATLFLDGFETTSLALHHALYELGKNKKVQEKLRREINENLDSDGTLPYDVMIELSYLDQVFYETMRMHTPLPFTTRVCSDDYIVTGSKDREIVIKKGTAIWVPIHSFHSDPDYFPSPEEFKPERFDFEHGGIKAFKDQFFLIPFGAGPRICLGNNFANAQVKGAIVEIVRHFEISIDKSMPDKVKIGAAEYLNVTDHKLLLNFKRI